MSTAARWGMWLLRLLCAVCATPLVVGWLVAVAYLEARVLPSTLVFLVLTAVGIGLALLVGMVFTLHADPTRPGDDRTRDNRSTAAEDVAVVAGWSMAFTVLVTLTVASTWAFGSVAAQHTCTVTEVGSVAQPEAMSGGSRSVTVVRLTCADGREETVGGATTPTSLSALTWTTWNEGDQVVVAYDPGGHLESRAVKDLRTPVRNVLVGVGTVLTVLLHITIVVLVAHQRRSAHRQRSGV